MLHRAVENTNQDNRNYFHPQPSQTANLPNKIHQMALKKISTQIKVTRSVFLQRGYNDRLDWVRTPL